MDTVDMEPDPRTGSAPSEPAPARLSLDAAHWVSGGSIGRWVPVYGRLAKRVALPGQQGRFVLTRLPSPPVDGTILRWVEHQRRLVTPGEATSPALVFWRLAVRQRAFAIDAEPCADVKTASDRVRRLGERAHHLHVMLGFLAGESVPSWVVCDGETPVMVGMPHYHLVPTADPASSLLALVATSRIKPQVHEVTPDL